MLLFYFPAKILATDKQIFNKVFIFIITKIMYFRIIKMIKNKRIMIKQGLNLAAVLAGAAIGATMGVLMAPNEGKETRKKLSDGFKSTADDMNTRVDELKNKVQGFVNHQKEDFGTSFDKLINKADHKKDDVIAALEKKLAELKNTNLADKVEQLKNNNPIANNNNTPLTTNKPNL